jgi:hypothetical protein
MLEHATEPERVDDWRLKRLLDAGFPLTVASEIAIRPDIDLHRALQLIDRGCKPELAAEILL